MGKVLFQPALQLRMIDLSDPDLLSQIEWASVVFNIGFTVFLALGKRWSWLLGLLGSVLGTLFFSQQGLPALTFLQVFFTVMGVFGYINWGREEVQDVQVKPWKVHVFIIVPLLALVLLLAHPLKEYLGSVMPYQETFVTILSVAATYLMAWKWLNQWLYWVVIDAVWLYVNIKLGFDAYAILSAVYLVLSVYGFWNWKRELSAAQ